MAAGNEGLPLTPFQAEKELAEAFVRASRPEPEKEAAILKGKAEAALIVKAGCGSKRKAEEDREEAPTAVGVMVQWNGEDDSEEDEFYKEYMSDDSIGYDSDEGPDVCFTKCKAFVEHRIEASNARHPWLTGKVADADGVSCGVTSSDHCSCDSTSR